MADTTPNTTPSVAYQNWAARQGRARRKVIVGRLLLLLGFLALWEYAPRNGMVNPMLTSYPSAVWDGFWDRK